MDEKELMEVVVDEDDVELMDFIENDNIVGYYNEYQVNLFNNL